MRTLGELPCPHGTIVRKNFMWRHKGKKASCQTMLSSTYDKAIKDWAPGVPFDFSKPEAVAHVVTDEGLAAYMKYLCDPDPVKLTEKLLHLASSTTACSLLSFTLQHIPNFPDNLAFVASRARISLPGLWFAKLMSSRNIISTYHMVNLLKLAKTEEMTEAIDALFVEMQRRESEVRSAVESR